MTTLQKTLITAAIASAIGAGIYESRQASRLRYQLEALQQQQSPLADELDQLRHDKDEGSNQLAAAQQEADAAARDVVDLGRPAQVLHAAARPNRGFLV